ncbi:glycosyltransferase [Terrisporobacter glycolicus]|nr:glycosyltransferase [Terrisporobacter glycolicus]
MKKIIIVSHWMEIGGAERSLLGILENIDYKKYSVDLFLCRHSGELMKYIPKEVNLLDEDTKAKDVAMPIGTVIKNKNYDIVFGRVISKVMTKLYNVTHANNDINNIEIEYSNKFTYKYIKNIRPDIEYDMAISFLEPHYIVPYKVNARKKVAWMHTDYSSISTDVKEGYKIWGKYDSIIAISQDCKDRFVDKYPKLKNKVIIIENILSKSIIIKQSNEPIDEIDYSKNNIVLLSIGRFCEAKNFENIPKISKILTEKGINFKWYIIGYGSYESKIREEIHKAKMEDHVIILGKKINPYPYIKKCYIYVQPSRYEGKSITVREAQTLNKPVIITKYPTANSQVINNFDGIICDMDNESCANAIENLINDKVLRDSLIENTRVNNYTTEKDIDKIYQLML